MRSVLERGVLGLVLLAGTDFGTVEDVRVHAERIYARSADENQTMPPVGGLSEEARLWLGDWLARGAP